jgi:hypothetical protein
MPNKIFNDVHAKDSDKGRAPVGKKSGGKVSFKMSSAKVVAGGKDFGGKESSNSMFMK